MPSVKIGAHPVVGGGAAATVDVPADSLVASDLAKDVRCDRPPSMGEATRAKSSDSSVPDFAPERAFDRPLWGEERTNIACPAEMAKPFVADRTPRVSVLLKSYNHAAFVAQTISSVLDQGFADFEIVATDDASSDGTADIIRQFDDPRIRLEVLAENVGISAAMNATIARARGSYLAILNSDDYALPNRLQRQVDFLDAHPDVALMFGRPRTVDETDAPTPSFADFSAPFSLPDFSRRSWLGYFFKSGNCLCAPTAMIRREAYDSVGRYDPRLFNLQDLDMWVRMVVAGFNIHVSDEMLTAFRIRDDQNNASAPTTENNLRVSFETLHILGHFAALPEATILEIFSDMVDEPHGQGRQLLGRAALQIESPPHQMFGLKTLFDSSAEATDHAELRRLMGSRDVFGTRERERFVSVVTSVLASRQQALESVELLRHQVTATLEDIRARTDMSTGTVPAWFDEDAYLRDNVDVAESRRTGGHSSGYAHWLNHGAMEGRRFRTK